MDFKYYQEIKIKLEKEKKAIEEKHDRFKKILRTRVARIFKKYLLKNITIKYVNCFDDESEKKGVLVGFHVRYDDSVKLFFERGELQIDLDEIIEISVNEE